MAELTAVEESLKDIEARCEAIESCYEYMLAYAAKGISGREGGGVSNELRHYLIGAVGALQGLSEAWTRAVEVADLRPAVLYDAYFKVLERDAADTLATLELVLAQPWISSLLIDNLNASLHLRALLTDVFLIDEIMSTQTIAAGGGTASDHAMAAAPDTPAN